MYLNDKNLTTRTRHTGTYLLWRSSKFIFPGMCASDDNVTTLEHLSGEPDLMKNVIYSVDGLLEIANGSFKK